MASERKISEHEIQDHPDNKSDVETVEKQSPVARPSKSRVSAAVMARRFPRCSWRQCQVFIDRSSKLRDTCGNGTAMGDNRGSSKCQI
ncbi:hypothetical protein KM043_010565 [Ampulex compressa]|nr:hypothetical protein KM043_010565 [Ampulex compressa]